MSDPLFKSVKELAQRSNPTPRALTEEASPHAISDLQVKGKSAFKLQKASVGGKAVLMPAPAKWQQLEEQHVCERVLAQKSKILKTVNPLF